MVADSEVTTTNSMDQVAGNRIRKVESLQIYLDFSSLLSLDFETKAVLSADMTDSLSREGSVYMRREIEE